MELKQSDLYTCRPLRKVSTSYCRISHIDITSHIVISNFQVTIRNSSESKISKKNGLAHIYADYIPLVITRYTCQVLYSFLLTSTLDGVLLRLVQLLTIITESVPHCLLQIGYVLALSHIFYVCILCEQIWISKDEIALSQKKAPNQTTKQTKVLPVHLAEKLE